MRLAGLVLVLALAACGPGTPGGVPIPAPDLSEMQPAVRRLLEEQRGAVRQAPASAVAWGRYGMALHAHDLLGAALECYHAAAACAPNEARWPYLMGYALERSGAESTVALAEYERSAALDSRYPPVHFRRGEILSEAGRLQEARAAFEQALALDPRLAVAHRGLGQVLLALDEVSQALAHFDEAERLSPGDPAVAAGRSQCFLRLGDAEGARKASEAAREARRPSALPDPYLFAVEGLARGAEKSLERGLAALAGGRYTEARDALAITLEARPDDGRANEGMGQALLGLGQPAEAFEKLSRATHLLGTTAARHQAMARCQLAMGKPEFALLLLQHAIELAPENVSLQADLATCLAQQERFEEAERVLAEAARQGALEPQALVVWGDVARAQARFDEARQHYLEALESWPGRVEVLYGLGLAEEGMGLRASAIERYRAVLLRQPKHPAGERLAALEDQRAAEESGR